MPEYRCRNCQRPTRGRSHVDPPYAYCYNFDPLLASEDPAGAIEAGATKVCDPYEVFELRLRAPEDMTEKLVETTTELFVARTLLRRALDDLKSGEPLHIEIETFLEETK